MNALVHPLPSQRAEWRAGATDLSERRRSGVSRGPIIDLTPSPRRVGITWDGDGAARIGALTTIATIAADTRLGSAYPGIVAAAAGLATPQIRHRATLGGNLAQHTRCWYYRNAKADCLRKGGTACPARDGNHLYGVAFDVSSCVAPHPSTMAAALLAYDTTVDTDRLTERDLRTVLGNGADGSRNNALAPGEVIESVVLPPPTAGERALYKRAISRTHAEWPLVELVVRAVIEAGRFRMLRLAAGGIAPVPLRLAASEAAADGAATDAQAIADIARHAIAGASPLPMTAYKLDLLQALVRDMLEDIVGNAASAADHD